MDIDACKQCFVCFSFFAVDVCLFIYLCVCFLLHFFISLKSCPPELFNRVTPQIWHLTFFIFLFDWLFVWNEGGHLYSSTTFHSKSGISLPQRSNSSSWENEKLQQKLSFLEQRPSKKLSFLEFFARSLYFFAFIFIILSSCLFVQNYAKW